MGDGSDLTVVIIIGVRTEPLLSAFDPSMDCLLQSASTAVGREEEPGTEGSFEAAQANTFRGNHRGQAAEGCSLRVEPMDTGGLVNVEEKVRDALSQKLLRGASTDSYAESYSTASSCSVDSSGCNSPVSTSTATSNFYFNLEAQEGVGVADEYASELRNFVKDLRGRPPLTRGFSLEADKTTGSRSKSLSDKVSMPRHLLPLREKSPRHTNYTFPLHSGAGWSVSNGAAHPASAPASAPESRRGSTHIGQSARPISRLSVTEITCRDPVRTAPHEKTDQSGNTMVTETPMSYTSNAAEEEPIDAFTAGENDDSGPIDEHATPLRQRSGQRQTEDICELILRRAFDVDLQDLTFATDALESVAHCLEELSTVVYGCRSLGLPVREAGAGGYNPGRSDYPGQLGQNDRAKKRPNSRGNGSGNQPNEEEQKDDGSGDEGISPVRSKKIKIEPPDNRYPCPYRKRNPLKFNVRDHNTCATTFFSDFTSLKRHIKLYHRCQPRSPNVCPRCGADQGSRERLLTHLQLPPDLMCLVQNEAQSSDPEEGITQEVEELLNERKSNVRVNTWPSLWRALFGRDDDVLAPDFVPPVEWDEVKHEFEFTRDDLKNRVQLETMTIKELRPEAQAYVADHMDHTCWDYISSVLSATRLQADYSSEKHHKRRRSQRLSAAVQSSPGDSLLPPVMQRLILPKPAQTTTEGGVPIGSGMASIGSNGSSLSSSWETAISNISSSNLRSTSSSTSLATPGEPQSAAKQKQSFIYVPASYVASADLTLTGSLGAGDPRFAPEAGKALGQVQGAHFVAQGHVDTDQFSYVGDIRVEEFALEEGLCGLFDYDVQFDGHGGNCNVYEANNVRYGLGDTATGHHAPP